jgi:transcriptional regulator with XRE-family HTH domain
MKVRSVANGPASTLPQRLRSARSDANLSQALLAKKLGVTPSAIAQWEQLHGTSPSLLHLQSAATVCRVSYEWLATGKGRRRGKRQPTHDEMPALNLETFAMNDAEELLLTRFRVLTPPIQQLFCGLFDALTTSAQRRLR